MFLKPLDPMELEHNHCQSCISIFCSVTEGCSNIYCPHRCGAKFHQCKLNDHETICPQVKVDCINAEYGCPFKLFRKYLGVHLEQCPASVVLCTMKWVREITTETKHKKAVNRINQLDVAMALKDQRTLNINTKDYCDKLPLHFSEENDIYQNLPPSTMNETENLQDHSYLLTLSLESRASTVTEAISNSKKFVFACNEPMQRQEFSYHYSNLHNEIQGSFNMMVHRCPLSSYGCDFSQHHLEPQNGFLTYNSDLKQLGVGFSPAEFCCTNLTNLEDSFFPNLPDIIFENILEYLDSLSIKNLSIVSHVLRDRCEQYVQKRGIVIAKWERLTEDDRNEASWRISGFKWMYSNCPSQIKKWQYAENCCISNHIEKCPYNVRIRHTKPELIPIMSI